MVVPLCFLFPIATVDFGLLNGDFKKKVEYMQ